ncbi:histidine phosphatase family protein [Paenibacillus vulneris]|uniref:Histidine phosphatase family protein n=1 Tax=Paenibacillus vulneris TaxID=1133364 RepID=A0ABW3UJI7_9BACL
MKYLECYNKYETDWNVEHRMQRHQGSALTELGVQQALWLRAW